MDNNYYIIIIIAFCLSVLYFNFGEIRKAGKIPKDEGRNFIYLLQPILLVGVLIRCVYISYPFGIFPDEAIAGYDSWCLANFGIDQHLASYPMYLKSWGTGQSAVQVYMALPFVKLFGLSIETLRLPMALTSSFAIVFTYWVLRKTKQNILFTAIFTIVLVVNPWHIMMSRWALDCNYCPNFILIGAAFFVLAYASAINTKKQTAYYLAGFAFLALAAYSYGVSWMMMPIMCLLLPVYFIRSGKMSYRQGIYSLIILFILALPLILFALLLFTNGDQYSIGPLTITQLDEGRHAGTTLFGSDNIRQTLKIYLFWVKPMIYTGYDTLMWNAFPYWGQIYNPFGYVFLVAAAVFLCRKANRIFLDSIFAIWLVSNIVILTCVWPCINHWNMVWFPLIYFFARGIYFCVRGSRKLQYAAIAALLLLGIGFSVKYFSYYQKEEASLWGGGLLGFAHVEEAVKVSQSLDADTIYYPKDFFQVHILFYYPMEPWRYRASIVNDNDQKMHRSFSKNRLGLPDVIVPRPRVAYVVPNKDVADIDTEGFDVTEGEKYSILNSK